MTVRAIFESYPHLSLKKLADTLEVNYNMVMRHSKQPVPGAVYDPYAINYEAIEAYLYNKKPLLNLESYDWVTISATCIKQSKIPHADQFKVGCIVQLRGDETLYELALRTESHIVLLGVGQTRPRVFSWKTLFTQSPSILSEETICQEVEEMLAAEVEEEKALEELGEELEAPKTNKRKVKKSEQIA